MTSESVRLAAIENAKFFEKEESSSGHALFKGFQLLAEHCLRVEPLLEKIRLEAPKYDLDAVTPGNGYRSFLIVFDYYFQHCLKLCRTVKAQRNGIFFHLRRWSYTDDLISWNKIFVSLFTFLQHLETLSAWSNLEGTYSLFPSGQHSSQELLEKTKTVEQYPFYGRHAAFQFYPSVAIILTNLLTLMAGYSDYYFSSSSHLWRVTKSLFMGTKYSLDADHRGRRIVNTSQFATVDFCTSFWRLSDSDMMKKVPESICPPLQVNKLILIPPEPLVVTLSNGETVNIQPPSAHGPTSSVQVRLMSAKYRVGMPSRRSSNTSGAKASDSLMIHCHGGGFVSNSSQFHETYLRYWAVSLDMPILSIDYSLAPEFPFPRQLQEILYAYAWALNNLELLGTTGKKIVFAGDSAGGNLMLSVTLWASSLNLPLPKGLFLAYTPLLVRFAPSPSRLLCLTDPLLPFGFMMRCLNAYAGQDLDATVGSESSANKPEEKQHQTIEDSEQLDHLKTHNPSDELDLFYVPTSPLLSPFLASDDAVRKLPIISFLTIELDPCLDDSVEFAKRHRRLGGEVSLNILPGLSHGFLNFTLLSKEAKEGSRTCVKLIKDIFAAE